MQKKSILYFKIQAKLLYLFAFSPKIINNKKFLS